MQDLIITSKINVGVHSTEYILIGLKTLEIYDLDTDNTHARISGSNEYVEIGKESYLLHNNMFVAKNINHTNTTTAKL